MAAFMKDNISPNSLFNNINGEDLPDVHLWDPPYCGEIDIRIHRNGQWSYNNSLFTRSSLVKLFSKVLKREADEYFLVTPVEKVKIVVDAEVFTTINVQQSVEPDNQQTILTFQTNLDEYIVVNKKHPVIVTEDKNGHPYPILHVRNNLFALISRSDFYQLVEWSINIADNSAQPLTDCYIESSGCNFKIGSY